jgi:hypothetical protein
MNVIPEVRALFVADKASVRNGGQRQQRESDALDDHEAAGHFQSFLEFLTLGIIRVFTYFLPAEIGAPVMENDTLSTPCSGKYCLFSSYEKPALIRRGIVVGSSLH